MRLVLTVAQFFRTLLMSASKLHWQHQLTIKINKKWASKYQSELKQLFFLFKFVAFSSASLIAFNPRILNLHDVIGINILSNPPWYVCRKKPQITRRGSEMRTQFALNLIPGFDFFYEMWLWCLTAKTRMRASGWEEQQWWIVSLISVSEHIPAAPHFTSENFCFGMCWTWFESEIWQKGFYQRRFSFFSNSHLMISIWLSAMTNALYVSAVGLAGTARS